MGILACWLGGFAPIAGAGMSFDSYLAFQGPDAVILDTDYDVILAVIRGYEGGTDTQGDPPRLLLEVTGVLRGRAEVDRRHAIWSAGSSDVDWIGEGADQAIDEWNRVPFPAPALGARFVLVGEVMPDGLFRVSPLGQRPLSAKQLAWAKRAIHRAPILAAERRASAGSWSREFSDAEVLRGARSISNRTILRSGDPILIKWAMLWRGRVIRLLGDGRVRVRPEGHDSRWDKDEDRENLLQYPESLLVAEAAIRKSH